jgi:DNA transposition AAA+ family ATPase
MERYGFSQNKAANEIGYTAPVISSYLANKYTGDVEKLEDAVIRWIARQEQARARKRVPLVETDHLVQITNAIALATRRRTSRSLLTMPARARARRPGTTPSRTRAPRSLWMWYAV